MNHVSEENQFKNKRTERGPRRFPLRVAFILEMDEAEFNFASNV